MELVRLIVIAYITEAIEQRIPNPFQDSHINPCQHAERLPGMVLRLFPNPFNSGGVSPIWAICAVE